MAKSYTSLHVFSMALREFEKVRNKKQLAAVRGVLRQVAKVSRTKARSLKEVKNARRVNPYIKVMIVPKARHSVSQQQIVGSVIATGIVAKIELGKQARRFRLLRFNGDPYSFKTKRGWVSVGDIKAGGQTFKRRSIIDMNPTNALSRELAAAQTEAAAQVLGS